MANGTRHRDELLNVAVAVSISGRGMAAMEAGLERPLDVAMTVSNLATRAEIFRHTEFPVDLDRALTDLSELLTELEPRIKDCAELA
jgi:hypothetical protein